MYTLSLSLSLSLSLLLCQAVCIPGWAGGVARSVKKYIFYEAPKLRWFIARFKKIWRLRTSLAQNWKENRTNGGCYSPLL